MREFIKYLWKTVGWQNRDACADDKALYLELYRDGKPLYIKFVPSEITVGEYNEAWDYSSKEKE